MLMKYLIVFVIHLLLIEIIPGIIGKTQVK